MAGINFKNEQEHCREPLKFNNGCAELGEVKRLKEKGYREYKQDFKHPMTYKTHLKKKVDSVCICESNDHLRVDVFVYKFLDNKYTFEVEITAEKNGLW